MMKRIIRSEDGTSFIELAIVLPLLALLVVGIIETGRWLTFAIQLSNAAHAGAQFASKNPADAANPPDIANAACNDSQFSCTTATPAPGHTAAPNTMFVSSNFWCAYSDGTTDACIKTGPNRNEYVQVSTSGAFKALLNFPYMPNSVPMSANAIIQVSQ
jgi:Flp pilus assembly protein TadG